MAELVGLSYMALASPYYLSLNVTTGADVPFLHRTLSLTLALGHFSFFLFSISGGCSANGWNCVEIDGTNLFELRKELERQQRSAPLKVRTRDVMASAEQSPAASASAANGGGVLAATAGNAGADVAAGASGGDGEGMVRSWEMSAGIRKEDAGAGGEQTSFSLLLFMSSPVFSLLVYLLCSLFFPSLLFSSLLPRLLSPLPHLFSSFRWGKALRTMRHWCAKRKRIGEKKTPSRDKLVLKKGNGKSGKQ